MLLAAPLCTQEAGCVCGVLNSNRDLYFATEGVVCCLPSASMCAEWTICSRPTPTEVCSYASCTCVEGSTGSRGEKEEKREESRYKGKKK